MTIIQKHYGGTFARPMTTDDLAKYEQLAAACPDAQTQGYMNDLITMMKEFWKTPASTQPGRPHPIAGTIVPLEEAEIKRIDPVVPWENECDLMGNCFLKLPTGVEDVPGDELRKWTADQILAHMDENPDDLTSGRVRAAAYHLLWYARELTRDREPITNDKL